jgi:exodeoxyribonuclease VII large subunit
MGAALAKVLREDGMRLDGYEDRATQSMTGRLAHERSLLEAMAHRRCLENPMGFVEESATQLLQSEQRLHDAIPRLVDRAHEEVRRSTRRMQTVGEGLLRPQQAEMARMAASLEALSPLKVLSRGYAIARDEGGHVVSTVEEVKAGQRVNVLLGEGSFDASVTAVHKSAE